MTLTRDWLLRRIDRALIAIRRRLMPGGETDTSVSGREVLTIEFSPELQEVRRRALELRDDCDKLGFMFFAVASDAEAGGEDGYATVIRTCDDLRTSSILNATIPAMFADEAPEE